VLFIASAERSGSTLLERLLGQVQGFCSVGEVVHLWERGLAQDMLCGCGFTFSDCPFWTQVGLEAFGGWGALSSVDVIRLKRQVDRHRFLPLMIAPGLSSAYRDRFADFSSLLARLYEAMAEVSGGIIIDSSKNPSYLFVLRKLRLIDLRMVHLVRDSRGVAYSATRSVRRPELEGEVFMPTHPPTRTSTDWLVHNALFDLAAMSGIPSVRLRYESLLADPKGQVRRILRFAGERPTEAALGFLRDGHAQLRPTHSVSGNPMRFASGEVPLRLDDEWRSKLSRSQRSIVSLITWPLLWKYGYGTR
jgi:hypothetical protein